MTDTEHSHYRDDTITRQQHVEVIRVIVTERNEVRAEVERLRALAERGREGAAGRPPNAPLPHVVEMAERIRADFGHGGANFPGARELYAAADKIEAWHHAARSG